MPTADLPVYGAPCWIDITSGDLEAAKPVYNAVFGWDFTDQGEDFGHYHLVTIGADAIGGAMQFDSQFMSPDADNAWTVYFATGDVAASLERVTKLGGTVLSPAMVVGNQGSMGVAMDPAGFVFGLWQPDQRKGFDRWGEHGFPTWFELRTHDFQTTSDFYAELLGVELGQGEMVHEIRYHTLNIGGRPVAGIWDISTGFPPDFPKGWHVYFHVNDPDAAAATIRKMGGSVLSEPVDTPHGRQSTVTVPGGATFTVGGDDPTQSQS